MERVLGLQPKGAVSGNPKAFGCTIMKFVFLVDLNTNSSPNSSSELETTGTMTMANERCAQSYTVKSNLTYVLFVM